jgi:hypothetical protein
MALSISQDYKDIAEQLINKYQTTFGQIDIDQILFLNESEKSPKKYADIQLVKSPYTFITNYKFILTVYEPKILGFTPAQVNILIMHELMHVDENFEKLVKHDLEDFSILCQTYGVDWDTNQSVTDPLV